MRLAGEAENTSMFGATKLFSDFAGAGSRPRPIQEKHRGDLEIVMVTSSRSSDWPQDVQSCTHRWLSFAMAISQARRAFQAILNKFKMAQPRRFTQKEGRVTLQKMLLSSVGVWYLYFYNGIMLLLAKIDSARESEERIAA